jgi:hypothetical protein
MGIEYIGTPVFIPERRSQIPQLVSAAFSLLRGGVEQRLSAFLDDPSREGFLRVEQEILQGFAQMSSHVMAGVVGLLHHNEDWVANALAAERERSPRPLRHRGSRPTRVRFLSGLVLALTTPYLSVDLRGRPGPTRRVGRRGDAGGGRYPALEALGVMNRATPALASEVARQSVRTASFVEAKEALAERGVGITKETVRALTVKVGEEALRQREARCEAAARGETFSDEFAGKRVVISADGGRLRVREGGQQGRKGKKARRRFRTPWREPKLVSAYLVDKKGRKNRDAVPLYDGTLGDADAAFKILATELKLRGAAKAKEIILVADGARWIWNRADELALFLGIDPSRIVKVADFYHAVEHLTAIAELRVGWNDTQQRKWVRRKRRQLKAGKVDDVITEVRGFCVGRNAKKIGTEVNYFVERRDFMQYADFAKRGVPLGSGGMESAIRRVVNLRLKGPSIVWRGPTAECMLHLRSYLKAGRWDELMARVMHRSADGRPAGQATRRTG